METNHRSRPLILVGGGGHCKSVIEAAESAGIPVKGILDLPQFKGETCLGYEVIGDDNDIPLYVADCDFIVTLGSIKDPSARIRLHRLVKEAGGRLAKVVASTATVSRHASLEPGTVVLHHANVNAGASIGKGCIINTSADIEHDAVIGDYCHISTGAIVNGNCTVGENSFIGSRAVIANGASVIAGSIVGIGSVVRKSIRKRGIYFGNPAILMKKL